jgi:hypothetical protein
MQAGGWAGRHAYLLDGCWKIKLPMLVLGRIRQNRVRAIPIILASAERNRIRFGIESGSDEPPILIK